MKNLDKKKIGIIIAIIAIVGIIIVFSSNSRKLDVPDLEETELKNVFELSTIKAYYHNVAKGEKKADDGLTHIGEKDRIFWLEYTGYANIGINMDDVEIKIHNDKVKIKIPQPEVLDYGVYRDKNNKIEPITSDDGWNKNLITQKDQDKAIANAQKQMVEKVKANKSLMNTALEKAKDSIEEHISSIGNVTGIDYEITWVLIEEEQTKK